MQDAVSEPGEAIGGSAPEKPAILLDGGHTKRVFTALHVENSKGGQAFHRLNRSQGEDKPPLCSTTGFGCAGTVCSGSRLVVCGSFGLWAPHVHRHVKL